MRPFRRSFFIAGVLLFFISKIFAQDFFAAQRAAWLTKAEQSKPPLHQKIKRPKNIVQLVKDTTAFQGWKTLSINPIDSFYNSSLKKTPAVVVDFGEHVFHLPQQRGPQMLLCGYALLLEKCHLRSLFLLILIPVL